MKEEKVSFLTDPVPSKISCDVQLQAFDVDGNEVSFTPKFHVSAEVPLLLNC